MSTSANSLAERFPAVIDVDTEALSAVSTDFGNVYRGAPIARARPSSIEQLQDIISWCDDHNVSLIPRGMSHSASGQCLSNGGVVIDMCALSNVLAVEFDGDSGTVQVEAGITWDKVICASLEQCNAAPPVLTDWQQLTVGGTLSTGGVGFMSHKWGVQIDNVLALDVITGSGELLHCSAQENTQLFNLALGGLGQYGTIARATLLLKRAPKKMQVSKLLINDTEDAHSLIQQLVEEGSCECIHAFLIPHDRQEFRRRFGDAGYAANEEALEDLHARPGFSYFLELVHYIYNDTGDAPSPLTQHSVEFNEVEDFYAYVTKEPPLIATERERGKAAHPELALFIPATSFTQFMHGFLETHRAEDMSEGPVLVIPMAARQQSETSFVAMREQQYFIGILRNAYPDTRERIDYLSDLNRSIYAQALACGGKRYPVDSMDSPNSPEQWQAHFGDKWEFVTQGKRRFDPGHTFSSLLSIHE